MRRTPSGSGGEVPERITVRAATREVRSEMAHPPKAAKMTPKKRVRLSVLGGRTAGSALEPISIMSQAPKAAAPGRVDMEAMLGIGCPSSMGHSAIWHTGIAIAIIATTVITGSAALRMSSLASTLSFRGKVSPLMQVSYPQGKN
jgi:hypothetical protein